ncbi:MAG: N-acetylmuramoyl-L-alanine amidase family protein [Lachnospiraceae bacterium]
MDKKYSQFYKKTNRKPKGTQKIWDTMDVRKKKLITVGVYGISVIVICVAIFFVGRYFWQQMKGNSGSSKESEDIIIPELTGVADMYPDLPVTEDFLTINRYSRPGLALSSSPQYIVIHYTANPGSTGWENRNYFENLKDTGETFASAQFVIGLDGQIIQCVPCNEMAYCSNSYNEFCISIEMCHPDETGNFNDETYNSCVYLVAHLMNYYHLDMDRLIRHYDVTGKNCPKYFVEHDDRWEVFKGYVEQYREEFKEEDEALYNQKLAEWEDQMKNNPQAEE